MRDLDKALADITAIRSQMARGAEFRGYGPVTVAATGVLALVAAGDPGALPAGPRGRPLPLSRFVGRNRRLSVILIGIEMVARTRRIHSGLADEMIHAATEQFIPAGVAGVLLTFVLYRFAPQSLWMLPGLWQIVFSLGLFASCRSLPRPMFAAALWYLATGLASLAFANGADAFSPYAMAVPYSVGQLSSPSFFIEPSERPMPKANSKNETGRFAYDGLDRVIHEKARLSVLTSLVAHPKGLVFGDLKQMCGLTDGNLSRHLAVLEEAGLIDIVKGYDHNRPQTVVRITQQGRRRYLDYLAVLEQVVRDAASAAKAGAAPPSFRG